MDTPASTAVPLRAILTDALRYWEPRRIPYNLVLAAVVVCAIVFAWPRSRALLHFTSLVPLFVLAVMANICYSACYAVDVPVHLSDFRAPWRRWQWLLWCVGTLLAAALAFYWMGDEVIGNG
jgi:hypothetical protein